MAGDCGDIRVTDHPPRIYTMADVLNPSDTSDFAQSLRARSYAVIRLDDEVSAVVSQTQAAARRFFHLPLEVKSPLRDDCTVYLGYTNNTLYDKEIYQYRRHSPGVGGRIWPQAMPEFERVVDRCYRALHAVAAGITRRLMMSVAGGEAGIGTAAGSEDEGEGKGTGGSSHASSAVHSESVDAQRLKYIDSLFEAPGNSSAAGIASVTGICPGAGTCSASVTGTGAGAGTRTGAGTGAPHIGTGPGPIPEGGSDGWVGLNNPVSMTNLSLFKYSVPAGEYRTTVHCPHHSDISLLTIIPTAVSGDSDSDGDGRLSGLHSFDFSVHKWLDMERAAPPGCAVVFTGECMAKVTANAFIPHMHEVANVGPGSRLSLAFQFCPAEGAVLDSVQLGLGGREGCGCGAMTAGEFIQRVSASRTSSNFPRNLR